MSDTWYKISIKYNRKDVLVQAVVLRQNNEIETSCLGDTIVCFYLIIFTAHHQYILVHCSTYLANKPIPIYQYSFAFSNPYRLQDLLVTNISFTRNSGRVQYLARTMSLDKVRDHDRPVETRLKGQYTKLDITLN